MRLPTMVMKSTFLHRPHFGNLFAKLVWRYRRAASQQFETLGMRWTSLLFKPRRGQEIDSIGLRENWLQARRTSRAVSWTCSTKSLEKKRALEVRDDSLSKSVNPYSLTILVTDQLHAAIFCRARIRIDRRGSRRGYAVVLSDDPEAMNAALLTRCQSKAEILATGVRLCHDLILDVRGEELDDLGERYTVVNRPPSA